MSVVTNRLSDIAPECLYTFFSSVHLCSAHAALAATSCFPSALSRFTNKRACCEFFGTCDDVLDNLFLDFVTFSKKYEFSVAKCVSGSCVIATRLALYCVCDHGDFMSFEIAPFYNNVFGILRIILVLLVVVFLKLTCHHFVLLFGD